VVVAVNNKGIPMDYLSVSEAARRLGAKPKDISDLFYRRALRDDLCPIVAGRRLIPDSYLPMVRMALHRAGRSMDTKSEEGVDNG
jgi:hypothetical protein